MDSAAGGGASRLALGTAQLGLDYGITNKAGRTGDPEARAILARTISAGVGAIDTAPAYGESEAVIGGALNAQAAIDIVTKTPKFSSAESPAAAAQALKDGLEHSLKRLRRSTVHALLFHDAADLTGPSSKALWQAAEDMKAAGLTARIGVSAYLDSPQLERILDKFPIEIVQIPYNALDRRAATSGLLDRLAGMEVEVHARSIFLQGLLLQPAEDLPPGFGPLAVPLRALHGAFKRQNLDPLAGLLAAALAERRITRLVCGVTTLAELDAILLATGRAELVRGLELPEVSAIASEFLNPARWPEVEASP